MPVAAAEGAESNRPSAMHLGLAIRVLVDELLKHATGAREPEKPKRPKLLRGITALVGSVAFATTVGVAVAAWLAPLGAWPRPADNWWLQVAVFAAVATVPHWLLELFAWVAETLSADLKPGAHVRGFRNISAYVGLVERPLFLGSLVAGYSEFIGVWFVFKGIAGFRVTGTETEARRKFQLFLLNSAVSVAGAALGWLAWNLLDLPTF